MSRRILQLALAGLCAASLMGCAASVTRPSGAPQERLTVPAGTNALVVVLVAAPQIRGGEDWAAFREEWITSLGAAGTQHKVIATLMDEEPAALSGGSVLARIRVNDYRYVSQAKRYGIGVLSGYAFMDLDVEFLAPPSKQAIGARKFTTSSSAWQGVFSAMTPKQVEAVALEIVKEVAAK